MATRIILKHQKTGILKDGYYGFSWTTLFFSFHVALFRSDFKTYLSGVLILFLVSFFSFGVGGIICIVVWPFKYNQYYTCKLIEQGYEFTGSPSENDSARAALRISPPA